MDQNPLNNLVVMLTISMYQVFPEKLWPYYL